MSLPEYPLDGLPLPRPEPLVAELGEGLVQHGVALRLARRRVEVWPEIRKIKCTKINWQQVMFSLSFESCKVWA